MENTNNAVSFRMVRGRIVPIRASTSKNSNSSGALAVAGGGAVSAGAGYASSRYYKKSGEALYKSGLAGAKKEASRRIRMADNQFLWGARNETKAMEMFRSSGKVPPINHAHYKRYDAAMARSVEKSKGYLASMARSKLFTTKKARLLGVGVAVGVAGSIALASYISRRIGE